MRPEYLPALDDLPALLAHASEECSEVIKECCKIQRFGTKFTPPEGVEIDFEDRLRDEIADVRLALWRLEEGLWRKRKGKKP